MSNKTKKSKTPDAILNGTLVEDGDNGKELFVISSTNNGYADLRMTVCIDDCDPVFSKQWVKRLKACVEACKGKEL